MITISEARKIIEANILPLPPATVKIEEACGLVLAANVNARYDSPPFDKSAMDGFALQVDKLISCQVNKLQISQIIKAGSVPKPLEAGTCAKIMTGAMIPAGADTVVLKEDVVEENDFITITRDLKKEEFVRIRGAEVKAGERLLDEGAILNSAAIGLLASQGIVEINAIGTPGVAILSTGDEIIRPSKGASLKQTQIFDSNYYILAAGLSLLKLQVKDAGIAHDDAGVLRSKITEVLNSKIAIITGGVSVGEFDHVKNILNECGVKELFWSVAQKPGKPLYLGITEAGNLVFGLPGNPAAVATCLYEYITPAIKKMMGYKNIWPRELIAKLSQPINWKRDRTEFVRGIYKDGVAEPIPENESHMLKGFVRANCLIIAEPSESYEAGKPVTVHLI